MTLASKSKKDCRKATMWQSWLTPPVQKAVMSTLTDRIVVCIFQVTIPVFFLHVCSFMWQFSRPPNPGLFACLQRLHNIDLLNRVKLTVCFFCSIVWDREPATFHKSDAEMIIRLSSKIWLFLIREQKSKSIQ